MLTLRQIKENLEALSTIEIITRVYQEIAQIRMNEIRQEVLSNREFIEALSQLYHEIKSGYLSSLQEKKLKRKEWEKISFIKRNGRKVAVFLSANQFFYGTLILDIWHKLLSYLATHKADLVVIGKIGKYLTEKSGIKEKIWYFELDDDSPKKEEVKKILDFIKNYEEIIVFYGKFTSALFQRPVQENISGGVSWGGKLGKVKKYLFEPSPEEILEFFETELISAFFHQVILEHRLSRYAARMVAMYQSTENAKEMKKKLKKIQRKLERQLLNKKQIDLFTGFALWK